MDGIKPKKTLAEETYEVLRDAICNGEFAPGERLMQDEIAARLNVSRQPVNSAISILKTNRLVEDTGRRGVIVAPIDYRMLTSIFEYRSVVEPFALRLAAERIRGPGRKDMEQVLAHGRRALASVEPNALVEADMRYHELLYRFSGNEIIVSSMRLNWHHIRRGMAEILRTPNLPAESWNEHVRIIELIWEGDLLNAQEVMANHIDRGFSVIDRSEAREDDSKERQLL
jgi:DNA-binding GntR family transcriptional regulator